MQLHQLKSTIKNKDKKRVGRGGKRGTFSGRGSKGQKSRAGARIRPGFRGGDNPIWKLFPKQRGASKKTDPKHAFFQPRYPKPAVVNLEVLAKVFRDGDTVSARSLIKKGIIKSARNGVKILGSGELNRKLEFSGVDFSNSAKEKVLNAGGVIKNGQNSQNL